MQLIPTELVRCVLCCVLCCRRAGEAYRYMNKVFKIVPIEGANWINNAPQKTAGEMHAEALIALTLSRLRCPTEHGLPPDNVTSAFVETMGVGVCRGSYSKTLSKAWRRWDKVHGSENDPVDGLPKDQHYFVLVMSDCGQDLEKYAVDGYDQARSLLLQTVLTLAVAEEAVEFEHRDMHWGNVMVAPAPSTTAQFTLRGCAIEVQTHGALTALIDFTASRLRTLNGDIAFCDLSADPELFEGPKGMVQFDSYRAMRKLIVGDDWSASCPQTNCVWVAYMAEVLAAEKGACMSAGEKKALRAFRRRVLKCAACSEVVWDELFAGLWLSRRPQQQC